MKPFDYFKGKLAHTRTKYAFIGMVSIVLSRCASLVFGFITTAIVVRYFTTEQFGLWAILTFLIGLVPVLDIGLGLALRNKLAVFYVRDRTGGQRAAAYFSSTFIAYLALAVLLSLLLGMGRVVIPWTSLFNSRDAGLVQEGAMVYVVSFVILILAMPFTIGTVGFFSFQQTHWNSFFDWLKSALVLMFVAILVWFRAGFVLIAISFSVAMALPLILSFFVFLKQRRWRIHVEKIKTILSIVRELFNKSIQFGVMQICAAVLTSTQALIVARVAGLRDAGEYALVQKLYLVINILHFAVLTPLWSAYTEAVASQDIRWVRKTLKAVVLFSVFLFTVGSSAFYVFGKTLIYFWTGRTVHNDMLYLAMGVWVFVSGIANCFSVYLNGIGKLKLQTLWLVVAACAYVPVTLWYGHQFGAVGVCLGGALVILPLAISNPIQAVFTLRRWAAKRGHGADGGVLETGYI